MQRLFTHRVFVFFLTLVALVAIVVLAGGLGTIQFSQGLDLPVELPSSPPDVPSGGAPSDARFFLLISLSLAFIAIPLIIYILIRYPHVRKRFLSRLIYVILWSAAFYVLISRVREMSLSGLMDGMDVDEALDRGSAATLPPEILVMQADDPLVNALSLGAAVLLAVALWLGWRYFRRRAARRRQPEGEQMALAAQAALDDIRSGTDLKNVVLRCYQEMSSVVAERQRIQRDLYVTPREFAHHLEKAGLPGRDVQRLTRLFESVRYGGKPLGPKEESEAILCLSTVIDALGGKS